MTGRDYSTHPTIKLLRRQCADIAVAVLDVDRMQAIEERQLNAEETRTAVLREAVLWSTHGVLDGSELISLIAVGSPPTTGDDGLVLATYIPCPRPHGRPAKSCGDPQLLTPPLAQLHEGPRRVRGGS